MLLVFVACFFHKVRQNRRDPFLSFFAEGEHWHRAEMMSRHSIWFKLVNSLMVNINIIRAGSFSALY